MTRSYCDRCKKEVQKMELSAINLESFYIKPPFKLYELCGQCQMDMVEHLTGMEVIKDEIK